MRRLVQLVYASAPSAIGGALITALGLGKKQTTTFEKPDIIVNQGDAPSILIDLLVACVLIYLMNLIPHRAYLELLLLLLTELCMMAVSFKTLGLLPGSVTQAGRFDAAGSIIRVSAMCSFLKICGRQAA